MADHSAAPLLLRKGDPDKLQRHVRSTAVRAGLAQRGRIVLLAPDGDSNTEVAQEVGTTRTTVAKAWRECGVAPWREGTFAFATDPELVTKVVDAVALRLAPPEDAVVLCVDEKSQIQALE